MSKKGKLLVFEGADGSGKTTQSKLLLSYLKDHKISCQYVSFPRYEDSMWAAMVKRFLLGDFGTLKKVSPYLASMLYAGDRMSAIGMLNKWIEGGRLVIANRYIGSNMAHMGAKFGSQKEQKDYIEWLEKLEYEENGIPKEDLVIFLHVPISISKNFMEGRGSDIHESDLKYQQRVLKVYEWLSRTRENWVMVDCREGGKILPAVEIRKKVLKILKDRKII